MSDIEWQALFWVVGGVAALITALLGIIRSLASKRITDLETLHRVNFKAIESLKERVIKIESGYATKEDLSDLFDSIQTEVLGNLKDGFTRVHQRIDELYKTPRGHHGKD